MPENADTWKCNKPIEQGKVAKYARCKLICQEGYDLSKGMKLKPKFSNKNSNPKDSIDAKELEFG